jgi:hypothetical protein
LSKRDSRPTAPNQRAHESARRATSPPRKGALSLAQGAALGAQPPMNHEPWKGDANPYFIANHTSSHPHAQRDLSPLKTQDSRLKTPSAPPPSRLRTQDFL